MSNQFATALYSLLLCCYDKQCDEKQHMRDLLFAHNSWGITILDDGENTGRKWPEQGNERVRFQLLTQSRENEPELEKQSNIKVHTAMTYFFQQD